MVEDNYLCELGQIVSKVDFELRRRDRGLIEICREASIFEGGALWRRFTI